MNTKFKYIHKRIWINLILGIVWIILGTVSVLYNDNELIPGWQIGFGLIYFGLYFYQKNFQYIEIKDGEIISHFQFGKRLSLNAITKVKYFAGEYTLEEGKKKLTISLENLNSDDKLKLKDLLDSISLNLKTEIA